MLVHEKFTASNHVQLLQQCYQHLAEEEDEARYVRPIIPEYEIVERLENMSIECEKRDKTRRRRFGVINIFSRETYERNRCLGVMDEFDEEAVERLGDTIEYTRNDRYSQVREVMRTARSLRNGLRREGKGLLWACVTTEEYGDAQRVMIVFHFAYMTLPIESFDANNLLY